MVFNEKNAFQNVFWGIGSNVLSVFIAQQTTMLVYTGLNITK